MKHPGSEEAGFARVEPGILLSSSGCSAEQVAVGAGAFEANVGASFRERIDQHPIRFDVAIAAPNEGPA